VSDVVGAVAGVADRLRPVADDDVGLPGVRVRAEEPHDPVLRQRGRVQPAGVVERAVDGELVRARDRLVDRLPEFAVVAVDVVLAGGEADEDVPVPPFAR
jgi:hypothetical protein